MWIFPDQGRNPCPLQWKRGVLTTGPPGKSSNIIVNKKALEMYSCVPLGQGKQRVKGGHKAVSYIPSLLSS